MPGDDQAREPDHARYCAEHDPILRAGISVCPSCQVAAFPVDAEWADDRLILATYPAACRHIPGYTTLVNVTVSAPGEGFDIERHLPGRHCAGTNARGRPCRAYARPGSDFCPHHRPDTPGPA